MNEHTMTVWKIPFCKRKFNKQTSRKNFLMLMKLKMFSQIYRRLKTKTFSREEKFVLIKITLTKDNTIRLMSKMFVWHKKKHYSIKKKILKFHITRCNIFKKLHEETLDSNKIKDTENPNYFLSYKLFLTNLLTYKLFSNENWLLHGFLKLQAIHHRHLNLYVKL